jgi:two-component system phosphate regulon response regulator OmpR
MEIQQPLSKAVLSLDDDVEVCALLEHLLWPHRVIGVAHAYVALELLAREAFDLFILDVRLPDMDGLQLCRRIRREDPNAPIVFCSGAASPADRLAAIHAGASAYYGKPLEPDIFQAGIEQLLYEAEERNRSAEAVAREVLGAYAQDAAPASVQDDDDRARSELRDIVYARFIEAGGTRAHFVRAWPAMLESALVAGPSLQPLAPAVGRHGG